jgi:predicted ATPase
MPNLATILGDDFDSKKSNENNTAVDAQKRLRYLFCQFIEVIAGCHEVPLILFLDDCQWIDNASVSLLNQILMTSEAAFKDHRLFFFGSCRDDEISETHPLNLLLSSVSSFGTKTTKIHLTHLSKGAVNTMVSTTLSLLPRITRPFANILHHKTKGSPLFVKQVMMELYKQRLLFPSLSRRRWVWEADKILDMKIPENVAAFIAKSLDRLPPEVLTALTVLSCFGARAEISLMTVLEREINQSLIAPLEAAIAYSVLRKKDGEFFFMHDKIQEAAYSMMQPEESCLHHNLYGQALGFVAMRNNDDKLLLTAAGQINHGGTKAVINGQQAVLVAKMNLDAGKKAMDMSDFFLADSLFVHGISYLRRGHWDEHYGLSLELFNLAAKCAMMNAEHDRVKILTGQIMRYVKCFQDKCQAIFITSTLLTRSGSGPEAVGLINSTLSSLGEELPATITPTVINSYLENTKAQLAGISNDTLLSYSAMTNPSKILAMEFLVKLSEILTLIGEKAAMPLIPLKMIQISLTYGMSPLSPVSFAQYGNYLALVRGEFEEGYRYVKFTLTLMKQMPSRAHDGSIMFYSNHTRLHVEPIQSSIGFYVDAYRASMKSGDPYAIASSYAYDDICLWSGKELIAVVDSMKKTMKETKYHKNLVLLTLMLPMFRMALRLMGQSDAPEQDDHDLTNAFGETWNEDDITGKHAFPLHAMFFVNLSEALVFREFDEARDAADKYFLVDNIVGRHFSTSTMFFRRL